MDAFELSIMIEQPIEEAFAVLANLENDGSGTVRLLKPGIRREALLA